MSKNAEPTMEITCKSSEITIHRIYAEHTKKNMLKKKEMNRSNKDFREKNKEIIS
jgi:hypothetical protein